MQVSTANTIFKAGTTVFAVALIKIGIDSLRSADTAAKAFGLPATNGETLKYIPVFGIRDLGFGAAIIALLVADHFGVIPASGGRAAAIVTAAGAFVGLGDSVLVRTAGGKEALGHQIGASCMALTAVGLWATAGP